MGTRGGSDKDFDRLYAEHAESLLSFPPEE